MASATLEALRQKKANEVGSYTAPDGTTYTRQTTSTSPSSLKNGYTVETKTIGNNTINVYKDSGGNVVTAGIAKGYTPTGNTVNSSNNTPTNTTTEPKQQIVPVENYQDQINKLTEAQKQKSIADLTAARDKSLSNLNYEKSQIAPQYYDAKNNVSVQNRIKARNFAEYMSNRGLANSGDNTQAKLMQNMTTQGQLGALDRQQNMAYDDIARRMSDVNNTFETGVASANAGIDAQSLQNYINQMNIDRTFNYGVEQDKIAQAEKEKTNYQNSITGLGSQMDYQAEIDKIANDGDTSNDWKIAMLQRERENKINNILQNEINTIGQYSADYDAEIKRRQSTPDTTDDALIPYLEIARQQKIQAIQEAQAQAEQEAIKNAIEQAKAQASIDNIYNQIYNRNLSTQYDINKPYSTPQETKIDTKPYIDYINKNLADNTGKIDTNAVANYLDLLESTGVDLNTLKAIAQPYGIVWQE